MSNDAMERKPAGGDPRSERERQARAQETDMQSGSEMFVANASRGGDQAMQEETVAKAAMEARKTIARMGLIARYQLDSAFIGVTKLALILGRSPSAIYADMRAGRFCLPYRLFNKTPMIFVDDLVEWLASGAGVVPAFGSKPEPRMRAAPGDAEEGASRALSREEVNAAIEKAADDAMRAAGIDPDSRRKRRRSGLR